MNYDCDFSDHLEKTYLILDSLKEIINFSELNLYLPWLSIPSPQYISELTDGYQKLFTVFRFSSDYMNYYVYSNNVILYNGTYNKTLVRVDSKISEEEFFQNSLINDYGSFQYRDIVNLKKIKSTLLYINERDLNNSA